MLVANFTSRIPTMGQTKTYEDWSKYLGSKPHRIGVVARMYTDNTLNFITDGLRNIFYKDEKADQFQLSSSLLFEWIVETNNIKKVEFAEVPTETGENGTEIWRNPDNCIIYDIRNQIPYDFNMMEVSMGIWEEE